MRKGPVTLLAWWGESWLRREVTEPCTNQRPQHRGQSPKVVLSVGTEEGSVSQGVPWVPQPVSRVTAVLPPSLGALLPMPPHRNPRPCSWQCSCGVVSPSPTGPLLLWRAGEEATAPGLAKTT